MTCNPRSHICKTPLPNTLFNRLQKIAGLKFLDGAVRVPSYVERMGFNDFHSWKQALQIGHDDLLQPHQVLWDRRFLFPGHAIFGSRSYRYELGQDIRHFDSREMFNVLLVANQHGQIQAEV